MTQDMNHNDMKRNMRNMAIRCNSRLLRSLLLLVMITVGFAGAWGATIDFNLPNGYYFLGNDAGDNGVPKYDGSDFTANFYMCPAYSATVNANNYLGGDPDKPLITTFKSFPKDDKTYLYAIWYVEAADNNEGYFYIKHYESEQFLVANDNATPGTNRRRVNLGPKSNPPAEALFKIQSDDDGVTFYISSKDKYDTNTPANKYLNPSKANIDNISATSDNSNTGGIIGFYSAKNRNSAWHFVNAQCVTPTITYDKDTHSVTITTETTGATVYYATGDTDPTTSSTNNGTSTITIENVTETTTFRAIAIMTDRLNSSVASQIIVPEQTIALAATSYTYTGTEIEPTVTVNGGDIPSSEYEVTFSDNKNAGTATATITNKPGGEYYVIGGIETFTITPAPLSITAKNKTITYGDEPTNDGVTYSGFVGGESENVLGGELSYTYNYSQYNDAGSYTITPSGLTSTNYTVAFNTGTLTVDPKEVGLEWGTTTFSYNGTVQGPTVSITGLVNGDEIGVTFSGEQTNAGTYTATATGLTGEKAGNYALPTANTQAFTISPKSIGDGNRPALGIHVTMEKNGDDYVVTVIDEEIGDGTTLTEGENNDYTISTETESDGDIVTITGQNNYTGSAKAVYATAVFYRQEETVPFAAVYNSKVDVMPPQAVTVYVVKKVNASIGTVTITPVSYIPADVPVVLEAETNLSGFAASPIDESVVPVSDAIVSSNLLKVAPSGGVPVESTEAYMFYLGEFVLTQKGTIAEGKFFLYNPNYKSRGGASARSLRIVKEEDDTMGIENIQTTIGNKPSNGIWHTLDGRRLNGRPVQKGLYIVNGKKVKI